MTSPWVTLGLIVLVVAVLAYVWDDLTEELRIHLDERDEPARIVRDFSRGHHPSIESLVTVSHDELVTPRGVVIPPAWLNGGLDLDDALDWLDYVEALG